MAGNTVTIPAFFEDVEGSSEGPQPTAVYPYGQKALDPLKGAVVIELLDGPSLEGIEAERQRVGPTDACVGTKSGTRVRVEGVEPVRTTKIDGEFVKLGEKPYHYYIKMRYLRD
jgi:hypothetical protein